MGTANAPSGPGPHRKHRSHTLSRTPSRSALPWAPPAPAHSACGPALVRAGSPALGYLLPGPWLLPTAPSQLWVWHWLASAFQVFRKNPRPGLATLSPRWATAWPSTRPAPWRTPGPPPGAMLWAPLWNGDLLGNHCHFPPLSSRQNEPPGQDCHIDSESTCYRSYTLKRPEALVSVVSPRVVCCPQSDSGNAPNVL